MSVGVELNVSIVEVVVIGEKLLTVNGGLYVLVVLMNASVVLMNASVLVVVIIAVDVLFTMGDSGATSRIHCTGKDNPARKTAPEGGETRVMSCEDDGNVRPDTEALDGGMEPPARTSNGCDRRNNASRKRWCIGRLSMADIEAGSLAFGQDLTMTIVH